MASYLAPETDQKWRARNVISFLFRHFTYKAPPGYRDVLLCAIDHANPTTGRCDVGQRKIALECNLGRQYVNKAMLWWEENTYFLVIENRPGRTNAYHIQWDNLEADWYEIQEQIQRNVTRNGEVTTGNVTRYGVSPQTRHPVSPQRRQVGVATDTTLTIKENRKDEPHSERETPLEKKERGFQEEKVIDLSANQTLAEREARARVKSCLGPFESRHLSEEAFEEAVAAELEAEGSGRVIVLKAANEAWKQKRNTA